MNFGKAYSIKEREYLKSRFEVSDSLSSLNRVAIISFSNSNKAR